jgi:hypothetical protein
MSQKVKRQPIYLRARQMIDPETGAKESVLVPGGAADKKSISERGVVMGDLLRAQIDKPRNVEFHRLAHKLADLVRENIDDFEGLDAHGALKRLQEEARVECDITRTWLPQLGMMEHAKARSIAFDSMEQGEFYQLVRGISRHIAQEYWPQCTPEEIERMIDLMPEETA